MKLENYELHLPSYSVGKEVYNQIGKICKPYGTKVLVIGGKKALSAAFDKISKNAADGGLDVPLEGCLMRYCMTSWTLPQIYSRKSAARFSDQ